jgi:hypothetical protein
MLCVLPISIAANGALLQQATRDCVDFVCVQFFYALFIGNIIRFTFFETQNIVKQLLKKA